MSVCFRFKVAFAIGGVPVGPDACPDVEPEAGPGADVDADGWGIVFACLRGELLAEEGPF